MNNLPALKQELTALLSSYPLDLAQAEDLSDRLHQHESMGRELDNMTEILWVQLTGRIQERRAIK